MYTSVKTLKRLESEWEGPVATKLPEALMCTSFHRVFKHVKSPSISSMVPGYALCHLTLPSAPTYRVLLSPRVRK